MSSLRDLPKVDVLAANPALANFPLRVRTAAARSAIDFSRVEIEGGTPVAQDSIVSRAVLAARAMTIPSLSRAINASGVMIHTGLGRARLAPDVSRRVSEVADAHSLLEFDEETGRRGDRQDHARDLLRALTGCQDALVVNNAAGGVLLALTALARHQEVILSRGQMVEIGGSFRMPEIVQASGCRLVEVGCTNKTHLRDYEGALTEGTAAILRCHPSNFKIIGFTEEPTLRDLAQLASSASLLLIDDQGSGCVVDTSRFGLARQPTLQDAIGAGADVVIASGDKLLGGPQAGIILGRSELIQTMARHPLARALRVDKLCLAALEATLRLYQEGREMEIPVLRYLGRDIREVELMAKTIGGAAPTGSVIEPGRTEVGGGCAPGEGVPTWRVGLATPNPDETAKALRQYKCPVIGRIESGRVWIDPRTVEDFEIDDVIAALEAIR